MRAISPVLVLAFGLACLAACGPDLLPPSEGDDLAFTDHDSPADRYAFPRPPLRARVELLGTSGEAVFDLDLLVVHLKAQPDQSSQARRRAAVTALEAWMYERRTEGGEPHLIVVGDWNDRIDDPASENVFRPFLDRPRGYRFLTNSLADRGDYSYLGFRSLIDHILVTTAALDGDQAITVAALPLELTVPEYRGRVSDHRPVLARLAVRADR